MLKIETESGLQVELRDGFIYYPDMDKMVGFECSVDELEEAIQKIRETFLN